MNIYWHLIFMRGMPCDRNEAMLEVFDRHRCASGVESLNDNQLVQVNHTIIAMEPFVDSIVLRCAKCELMSQLGTFPFVALQRNIRYAHNV